MTFDQDQVHEYLCMHLQDKLEASDPPESGCGEHPPDGDPKQRAEVFIALDRYQHRIWQLKDRLSCQVYGPQSKQMADEFLAKYELEVTRDSQEYYWVLRKVLQTEIRFYTMLMQQLNGDNGDLFVDRKMARNLEYAMDCFQSAWAGKGTEGGGSSP